MTNPVPSTSVLSRITFAESGSPTPLQSQVDGLVSHFVEEAANPTTLAAMMAGGFAYRMGRIGTLAFASRAQQAAPLLQFSSYGIGLASEVTAFELTNRILQTFAGAEPPPLQNRLSNLWSWSGPGGWRDGLMNSLITFGMLKGAGHLAREQNLIFQHAFQSTAMVAGHNTVSLLGIAPRPEGSLAEQILHAEATNLQLGAGMSLVHAAAPGISAWERSLDMAVGAGTSLPRIDLHSRAGGSPPLQWNDATFSERSWVEEGRLESIPHILMMSAMKGRRGSAKGSDRTPPRGRVPREGSDLKLWAQGILTRIRERPYPESVTAAVKSREGLFREGLERVWQNRWKGQVTFSQWRVLVRGMARKMAVHFPEAEFQNPERLQALGEELHAEVRLLQKNGWSSAGRYSRHLMKISAADILAMDQAHPRSMVQRALDMSHKPQEKLLTYQENFNAAHKVADEALAGVPEAGELAQSIANFAYYKTDPKNTARVYVEGWKVAYESARKVLEGIEELRDRTRSIARSTFYVTDPSGSARRHALIFLMGADPRDEMARVPRLILRKGEALPSEENEGPRGRELLLKSLDRVTNGMITRRLMELSEPEREALENLLEEVGEGLQTSAEAELFAEHFRRIDLSEGAFQAWEGLQEFFPQDSFRRFGGKNPEKIRLANRSLIQKAPLMEDRAQLLAWLWKNKASIDRLAGPGLRYSYHTVVESLRQAGRLEGDIERFLTLGSLLEFDFQRTLHPDLESFLPPSPSFRVSWMAVRRYLVMLSALQRHAEGNLLFLSDPSKGAPSHPHLYLEDLSHLEDHLISFLGALPPQVRSLEVHFAGRAANGFQRLPERVMNHPTLRELRFFYPDGSIKSYLKTAGNSPAQEQTVSAVHPWVQETKYQAGEVERLRVITPWEEPKVFEPFPQLMARLREESGFSLRDISTLLQAYTGSVPDEKIFGLLERDSTHRPSFGVIQGLSQLYGVDVRELIDSSNRTRHPEISPEAWRTPHYPIYLENLWDVERVSYFHEQDPQRRTMGWLIFSIAKNPHHYLNTVLLSQESGLENAHLRQLELNRHKPHRSNLIPLAKALRITPQRLVEAITYTFDADMIPTLARLFPKQAIFLEPSSQDREKVLSYGRSLRSEKAPSIGQILFRARQNHPDLLGVTEMSVRLGKDPDYWERREANRVPVTAFNLPEWMDLFQKIGLPGELLHPFLKRAGLSPENPRALLAQAMGGMTLEELSVKAGVGKNVLTNLLDPSRQVEPAVVLDLKRTLPDLEAPRLYRILEPSLTRFFPEAAGEKPTLALSVEQIYDVARLNLAEKFFAYRMEHYLGKKEMGDRLGVSISAVDEFERSILNFEKEETWNALAQTLSLDPRLVFLHYHPEILEIIPVVDPQTGQALNWSPLQHSRWRKELVLRRDATALREEIRRKMWQNDLKSASDLARFLGITEMGRARKLMGLTDPLSLEDILLLKSRFPALSVREWYEHFNHSSLAYFLGRKADGSIHYDLPQGMSWKRLARLDLYPLVEGAILKRYPSLSQASHELKMPMLLGAQKIRKGIDQRNWVNETIALMANTFGLNRRLLYFYFRQKDLQTVLEGEIR